MCRLLALLFASLGVSYCLSVCDPACHVYYAVGLTALYFCNYRGVGRDGTTYECQFELRNEVIPQASC